MQGYAEVVVLGGGDCGPNLTRAALKHPELQGLKIKHILGTCQLVVAHHRIQDEGDLSNISASIPHTCTHTEM